MSYFDISVSGTSVSILTPEIGEKGASTDALGHENTRKYGFEKQMTLS